MRETRTLSADQHTWVQAGIGLYMQEGVPLDRLRDVLVSRALAALMNYWRFDVPDRWKQPTADAVCTWVGFRMRDYLGCAPSEIGAVADEIHSVLEASSWQTLYDLPNTAWRWVHIVTGLDRHDWEQINDWVAEELDSWVRCPRCGWDGQVRDAGILDECYDPYAGGGSSSIYLKCSHCQTKFKFDAKISAVKRPQPHWDYIRWLLVWSGLVLIFGLPALALLLVIFHR